ncbi:MAG: hypothetical protein AB1502_09855 [Thermodesulfobacteriota bacterium]
MVICPQCSIEHEIGEEFCRKCGSFLLTDEEPAPEGEKTKVQLICPKCQTLHKKGNYCKKCGSLLVQATPFRETDVQSLEKKSIQKRSKEWLKLFREKKELEISLSKLETQRDRVSSDVFNPLFVRYQDRLESLSSLHQEIETELDSVRKRASKEIDFLEKELKPIQKRLEEFQFLYKQGAVTKADFLREKNEMIKDIKSRERSLKKYRQIVSLLPSKMGGSIISSGLTGYLFRPLTLLTASAIIILMGAGVYFLRQWHSQSSRPIAKEIVASPSTPSPPQSPGTVIEGQEVEKIKSLFENIRQANLQKNIDLFMSCFSRDFNGREGKRLDTIETWKHFNYLDLSYDLKKQTISGNTANVRLEWLVRVSQKVGGQQQDSRIVLDATLKREDGRWKIKEIKPIS